MSLPVWWDAEAHRDYQRVIAEMQRLGFWHPSHRFVVELYAGVRCSARRSQAEAEAARAAGNAKRARKASRQAAASRRMALDIASELGLTPASRLAIMRAVRRREGLWAVKLPPPEEDDDADDVELEVDEDADPDDDAVWENGR